MIAITLSINGQSHHLDVPPDRTLLQVLRQEIGLRGTKSNCQAGECGACTVVVDGRAINSCLYLAARANRAEILTVEGLSDGDSLHPAQEAFVRNAAVQCGYCTPGFLMSSAAVMEREPTPSIEMLREAVAGNICRCTGYTAIHQALNDLTAPKAPSS